MKKLFIEKSYERIMKEEIKKAPADLTAQDLNKLCGKIAIEYSEDNLKATDKLYDEGKKVIYLSMEYLMGRGLQNNMLNLGIYDEVVNLLKQKGIDPNLFEDIEDQNLGNGGLGRLAACYMESSATNNLPVLGYGLRYKKGFFKQQMKNGEQIELEDDWLIDGEEPWSIRKEEERILVEYKDQSVWAVPYDIPIFGYKTKNINTLRVWQAEPIGDITDSLYPNDNDDSGKKLRLKQEYMLVYASIKDIVQRYRVKGGDFRKFNESFAIQLNDTHPVLGIPVLLNILLDEKIEYVEALEIVRKTFSYTNHTILSEALEKWSGNIMRQVAPKCFETIDKMNRYLIDSMRKEGKTYEEIRPYQFIVDDVVYMARIAIFNSHHINGVAEVHTKILKQTVLSEWYSRFPERFINVTNGITPRRWVGYANKPLASYITEKLSTDEWLKDYSKISGLSKFAEVDSEIMKFAEIKYKAKCKLADYILKHEGISIDPTSTITVQVKRIHEYKRQLLNLLGTYDYYMQLKTGEIKIADVPPVTVIMAGKAAPGYRRAKTIIRLAKKLERILNADEDTNKYLKFVFLTNFNVSYGEVIYPAADISEQISTAGKEASGTGNMKFMASGAVTLGTLDGANIEIVEEAGIKNNYIFGAVVDELKNARIYGYTPRDLYSKPENYRLKRAIDFLIEDRNESYVELYHSLLDGWYGEEADVYFLCKDFNSYIAAKEKAIMDSSDKLKFYRKGYINMCSSGKFTSDRSVLEYANNIWSVKPRMVL
ncbi:MAG: glycogen/starch/alpha-glucan family phosphorylase [Clostridia bacterium]